MGDSPGIYTVIPETLGQRLLLKLFKLDSFFIYFKDNSLNKQAFLKGLHIYSLIHPAYIPFGHYWSYQDLSQNYNISEIVKDFLQSLS